MNYEINDKLEQIERCIDDFIKDFDIIYFCKCGGTKRANLEKIEELNKILECKLLIKRIKGE